jgi:hypothetical protein
VNKASNQIKAILVLCSIDNILKLDPALKLPNFFVYIFQSRLSGAAVILQRNNPNVHFIGKIPVFSTDPFTIIQQQFLTAVH